MKQNGAPRTADTGIMAPNSSSNAASNVLSDGVSEMGAIGSGPGTPSEEDYDDLSGSPSCLVIRRNPLEAEMGADGKQQNGSYPGHEPQYLEGEVPIPHSSARLPALDTDPISIAASKPNTDNDNTILQDVMRKSHLHHTHRLAASEPGPAGHQAGGQKRSPKFADLVFTRKFSAFDRQNRDAANSPFHGFFTLFWMAVFFFVVKIGADNWKTHGSPLGTNEIMRTMFRRDVLVLLVADGVMCAATGVGWLLQRAIRAGYVDWGRTGWVLQNVRSQNYPQGGWRSNACCRYGRPSSSVLSWV